MKSKRNCCHSERDRFRLDGRSSAVLGRRTGLLHRFLARSVVDYKPLPSQAWFFGGRPHRVRSSTNCGASSWVTQAGKRCKIWFKTRIRSQRPGFFCGPNRCDAAFWCIGRFRAVADLAQCNLGVQSKPGRGILGIIQDRILSFGFILVVGFLLLVSLFLTAAIALVGEWSGGMMPGMEALGRRQTKR